LQHQINKKMNKKYFFRVLFALVAMLFSANALFAQSFVNELFAKEIGDNFISKKTRSESPQLKLFHTENGEEGQPNLYIFNVDGGGFVIVSASKNVKPVLAYSDKGSFENEIPWTAQYFIDNYRRNVDYYNKVGHPMNDEVVEEWKLLENNELLSAKNAKTVESLIQTQWNQDCYYNYYAPQAWGGPCNRCYAGCVACAMSQVMKYWNHPAKGYGSHSYTHGTYGVQSADFGATTYDWDNMPNSIWNQNNAIATLMYHCGVSVDMNFSPTGSGAYSPDVETALRQYFGYCSATYVPRSGYSEEAWIALLKSELDKSQPMYFSGSSDSGGGHAIVCDGYDENDYFSFNMGWSGSANGFYSINDVYGYHNNEAVVMNIVPLEIKSDENGIIYVTPDGTGDGSSWENATPYLQYATSRASDASTVVWVKTGTYYGDTNSGNGAFSIYKNNRVYGGFAGNEAPDFNLDNRDFEANPTILDGQNARRVLYQTGHFTNMEYSIFDGFVIQNGNAGAGAGAYLCSNSHFANCKFLNNSVNGFGGGVHIISAFYNNATVRFTNCVFEGNTGSLGGAMCDMMGANLVNCRFNNNTATTKGGACYIFADKETTIVNTIFDHNNAKLGGAMYNKGKITVINCNFVNNNSTEDGGGMFTETKYNKIYNTVFWGNVADGASNQIAGTSKFSYCAVEGGVEGENIINLDSGNEGTDNAYYPRFTNPDAGDYSIDINSVCVDAGNKSINGVTNPDFLGNQRVVNGQIDIGAIECQTVDYVEPVEAVNFAVYPNPVDNQLFIKGDGVLKIEIYNSIGQKIISAEAQNEMIFDTSDFENGVYFVKVNGVTKKIVK